jgi:hypothetical protein
MLAPGVLERLQQKDFFCTAICILPNHTAEYPKIGINC